MLQAKNCHFVNNSKWCIKTNLTQKSCLSFNAANPKLWAQWTQNLNGEIFRPNMKFLLKDWKDYKNYLRQVWQQRKQNLIVFLDKIWICAFSDCMTLRGLSMNNDSKFTSSNSDHISSEDLKHSIWIILLWYFYGVCCHLFAQGSHSLSLC